MLALERDSATASHWQPDRYDKVFSEVSPRRVALLIEHLARRLAAAPWIGAPV